MNNQKINAVYDDELLELLKNLREIYDINQGNRNCKICKCIITIDNIGLITPDSGSIKYICNKENCLITFNELDKDLLNG